MVQTNESTAKAEGNVKIVKDEKELKKLIKNNKGE